jgi:hypothetical protein
MHFGNMIFKNLFIGNDKRVELALARALGGLLKSRYLLAKK